VAASDELMGDACKEAIGRMGGGKEHEVLRGVERTSQTSLGTSGVTREMWGTRMDAGVRYIERVR
jgi:hypothetical protein